MSVNITMWKNYSSLRNITIIVFLASILAGCVTNVKPANNKKLLAFTKLLRGTVYLSESEYKIRLCGSSTIVSLIDQNHLLDMHFLKDNEIKPSLYIEFNAIAVQQLDWQVVDVFFVSQHPQQCGANIQSVEYAINSQDNLWQAHIKENKVVINKSNIYSQLSFNTKKSQYETWYGTLQLAQGRQYDMRLKIENKVCLDKLGQWYSLSANLDLNGEEHLGCARKGEQFKKFASGNYSNQLTNASAFIVLDLQQDNSARLILDYRNGHPMIVNNGRWRMLSNQVLELSLDSQDARIAQSVMLFQVFNNHELRLKGFSELLGNAGLKLLPNFSQANGL
ncbi:MAG: hypothetical protein V7784_14330 [Oceanospirillaceae bacterium]